jgi:dTMP kinase
VGAVQRHRSVTGILITIDGPGGSGKTTAAAELAGLLRGQGRPVRLTAEPSAGPVGTLARALVNEVSGHTLACLVAADRYHHLDTEIRPSLAAGHVVVCDRYLACTLVLQARDGLAPSWLLTVNEAVDLPGLAVILTASPQVITARLDRRGRHDRFEDDRAAAAGETAMFRKAAGVLAGLGVRVLQIDTTALSPRQAASRIAGALDAHCASLSEHG